MIKFDTFFFKSGLPLDLRHGVDRISQPLAAKVRVAADGLDVCVAPSGFKRVASMKRGAPYFDLWALATKEDMNEEELLTLAKNHFTPK